MACETSAGPFVGQEIGFYNLICHMMSKFLNILEEKIPPTYRPDPLKKWWIVTCVGMMSIICLTIHTCEVKYIRNLHSQ